MSERKAINKWYPPDYDPSLVPKIKKKTGGNLTIKIRMMTPYSMRCLKCNEYIAQRRSFNAKKETLPEKYLNTSIIRFHISCPVCSNSITFKTNPQTAGYTPESGAVRNFQSSATTTAGSRLPDSKVVPETETDDQILERLAREDQEDSNYQLLREKRKKNPFWNHKEENKDILENLQQKLQQQQKQQMINDHLEELQSSKAKIGEIGDELLQKAQQKLAKEDDAEVAKSAFKRKAEESERVTVSSTIAIKKRNINTTKIPQKIPPAQSVATISGYSSDED